jgi:hypothetical protein
MELKDIHNDFIYLTRTGNYPSNIANIPFRNDILSDKNRNGTVLPTDIRYKTRPRAIIWYFDIFTEAFVD